MTVTLIVEGGGDGKDTRAACRRGFAKLCEKLGLSGRMPSVIASGSRGSAFRDFCKAMRNPGEVAMLLVDSEDPVSLASPWQHLANRPADKWQAPPGATDDHCHLMVQCMEAWLVADPAAVAKFFAKDFQAGALPKTKRVEQILKADLLSKLGHASRNCTRQYAKGATSFDLLAEIDPALVRAASRWAARFFDALLAG